MRIRDFPSEVDFFLDLSNKGAIIYICVISPIILITAIWSFNVTKDVSFLLFFLIYLLLLLLSLIYLIRKELNKKGTELKLCPYCNFKTKRDLKYCPNDQKKLVLYSTYSGIIHEPKYDINPTKQTHFTKLDSSLNMKKKNKKT